MHQIWLLYRKVLVLTRTAVLLTCVSPSDPCSLQIRDDVDIKVKLAGSEKRMELLGVNLQEEPNPDLLLSTSTMDPGEFWSGSGSAG